mmetsp:Transcript_18039/g.44576  ORF Transcript_18039/g.44576 Transcript_18039/m.44576 type:complete len:454 (+) Transcript_18039:204-1565(+)
MSNTGNRKSSIVTPSNGNVHALIQRIQHKGGIEVQPGVRMIPTGRTRGGTSWDAKRQQKEFCEAAILELGNDAWLYANRKGGQVGRLSHVHKKVSEALLSRVPYQTFYKWFVHYLKFGETGAETRQRDRARKARRKHKKAARKTSFSQQDSNQLQMLMEEKPHLYLDEIQAEMVRRVGKKWSTSTLWTEMHRLGYTLQAAVYKAKQRSEEQRELYRARLRTFLPRPEMALFIDETHKSANASRRPRVWSKRGQPRSIDAYFEEEFRRRYTLIGACDIKGFVPHACKIVERERDKTDRDPERGTVDSERFEKYLVDCVLPVLGDCSRQEPRSLVIMDNASIHCSDRVRQLIESVGACLIYTAPYSPDLNPIEWMFSVYKAGLKRRMSQQGLYWQTAHEMALKDVTPQKAYNYFVKAEVPGCKKKQIDDDSDLEAIAIVVSTVIASSAPSAMNSR